MTKTIFAAPVQQEYATRVEKEAEAYGVHMYVSSVGCGLGELGIYCEFCSQTLKMAFLNAISGTYIPENAWVA